VFNVTVDYLIGEGQWSAFDKNLLKQMRILKNLIPRLNSIYFS